MSLFCACIQNLSKRVKVVSSNQLSLKCEIIQKKSVSKNVIRNTLVESQLRLLKNVFKGNPVYFVDFMEKNPCIVMPYTRMSTKKS